VKTDDPAAVARAIMDEVPASHGAGPQDLSRNAPTLALLILLEAGPMAIGELAVALGISVATASITVAQAAHAGLVERVHDFDHRRHVVALTPKGIRLREGRRANVRAAREGGAP
jgi:Mn-dependent DtxR family transcriptional regulator